MGELRKVRGGGFWIIMIAGFMAGNALAETNITWTNLAPYAVAQGNGVKKNSGPSDWVCGPYSNESIASGDFYIEFPVNETNKHRHLGFSANPGATNNYYSLTASIRVQADAKAYSYIGSGSATFLGTVIVGTKLGIQVVGGTVTFFRDDVEVGNSYIPAITYPVHVDTCLHTNEGSFTDVMFGSGLPGGGAIMNQALANDPDDADNSYGAGDSIIISFDADTGSPTGSVDSLFSFNQSIGNSYSGSWNGSGDVYTITINTPAANAPQRIATIISGLGDLDGASAELLGDWGGRPVTWSSVTNLNPGANGSITKSWPTSDWNAGAVSNVAVLEQLGAFGFVAARHLYQ